MFAELSTEDRAVAFDFMRSALGSEYAMVTWQIDSTGRCHVSVNTEVEPPAMPS